MLKLIILSLLGKKMVSPRVLYNSIKTYLIVYMMVLPAFLGASTLQINLSNQTADPVRDELSIIHPGLEGIEILQTMNPEAVPFYRNTDCVLEY